jgi:hypothetical protein
MQISASSMGYHWGIVDSSKFPTSRYLPDFASECVYLRPWPFNRTRCMSLYFMNVFSKMLPANIWLPRERETTQCSICIWYAISPQSTMASSMPLSLLPARRRRLRAHQCQVCASLLASPRSRPSLRQVPSKGQLEQMMHQVAGYRLA